MRYMQYTQWDSKLTNWNCKQTAVGEDKERNSTLEEDVLSDVKRQWTQPTVLCTHNIQVSNDTSKTRLARWCSGRALTRDQEVAGSTPTAALLGQQPWASCSHLMCLCSPSSITWYLARAFMLMRRNVAAGIGSNEQGECLLVACRSPSRSTMTLC